MRNLKERTVRGGISKLIAQGINFVLRVGSLMVLARLLSPAEFGLVGMVTAVTGVFALFRDAGLSTVTIQRASIRDREVSALFWINMAVGTLLALLSIATAPALVAFYGEPKLFWVTVALGAGFLINAAGVQHSAILQRHMRFGTVAVIDVISLVIAITVGISMAWAGARHWALVAMALIQPAIATIGFWLKAGWFPGRPRRESGVGSMLRFGGTMTFNSLIVYLAYNTDKMLLGRLWGADALGIYGRAYQLINIPTDNLYAAVGGVAVSALSRLQNDPQRFKSYFLKGYSLVAVLTIPVTATCALFATDIVLVLLGVKWVAVTPIFRLLAPTIIAFSLINPVSWVLLSTGRVDRSLRMALVIAPVVVLGYAAGLSYGPEGVALGYSAAMVILILPMIVWAMHGTGISAMELVNAATPPLLSAATAALIATGLQRMWLHQFSPLLRLVLEVGALFTAYVVILFNQKGQRTLYLPMIRDVLGMLPARSRDVPVQT
jgi:PST family polysaccharide transporter